MNKTELVKAMAAAGDISQTAANRALQGCLEAITNALADDDNVTLIGFGSFSVKQRAGRTGRNPQTGKSINIPAQKVAKFKAGKKLADAVK